MKLRWIAAAAFALVVLACLPTGAGAKIRHDGPPVGKLTRFELEGSNGYSILVVTNRRQRLMLKTKHEGFVAEYWTRDALASPDRVQAKLPGLGSISVRFHPRGSVRHPSPPECEKPFPTVQPGVVRGTIKFVGEHEYTRVEAHEAKAEIEEPTSWSCSFAPYEEPIVPGGGEWDSKLITSALGVELLARKYQPGVIEGGGALYHVETAELLDTDPSLIVYRSAMSPRPVPPSKTPTPNTRPSRHRRRSSAPAASPAPPNRSSPGRATLRCGSRASIPSPWPARASKSTTACATKAASGSTSITKRASR